MSKGLCCLMFQELGLDAEVLPPFCCKQQREHIWDGDSIKANSLGSSVPRSQKERETSHCAFSEAWSLSPRRLAMASGVIKHYSAESGSLKYSKAGNCLGYSSASLQNAMLSGAVIN